MVNLGALFRDVASTFLLVVLLTILAEDASLSLLELPGVRPPILVLTSPLSAPTITILAVVAFATMDTAGALLLTLALLCLRATILTTTAVSTLP